MSRLHICDFPDCGKQIDSNEVQRCIVLLDLSPEEQKALNLNGLPAKPVRKSMELCRQHALEIKKLVFPELIQAKKEPGEEKEEPKVE